jgi:hypothetical protein
MREDRKVQVPNVRALRGVTGEGCVVVEEVEVVDEGDFEGEVEGVEGV